MKIPAIALLVSSTLFLSACQQQAPTQQEAASTNPVQAVAEPQPAAPPAIVGDPKLVCFVDELQALAIQPETELLPVDMPVVRGWIGFLNANGMAPSNFEIVLTSPGQNYNFPAMAGLARQDVADTQTKPGLLNSGYETVLSLKDVKPGRYEITMTAPLNNETIACGTGKFLVIK